SKRAGFTLTVLVHTKHAETFNRLLARLDTESQLNLIQVTEVSAATVVLLSEKIGRGEFVAIAGDRIPVSSNPRIASASFLGEMAPVPVGLYVLANLLGCPVYLLFSLRAGRATEIHLELFRESILLPRQGRDHALAELVADYARRLEYFCLRAPLQWFNFYDFWHLSTVDTTNACRSVKDINLTSNDCIRPWMAENRRHRRHCGRFGKGRVIRGCCLSGWHQARGRLPGASAPPRGHDLWRYYGLRRFVHGDCPS